MACANTFRKADIDYIKLQKTRKKLSHPVPKCRKNKNINNESYNNKGKPNTSIKAGRLEVLNNRIKFWSSEVGGEYNTASKKIKDEGLLVNALGNEGIPGNMAEEIPKALNALLDFQLEIPGLMSTLGPARGTGRGNQGDQTTLLGDMGGSNKQGVGMAYELIQTHHLLTNPIGELLIDPYTDQIAFHQKGQGGYSQSLSSQKRTCEADLHISRKVDGGYIDIGVDYKYQSSGLVRLKEKDIKAFMIALISGELDELYYVTNREYSANTIKRISNANKLIYLSQNHILPPKFLDEKDGKVLLEDVDLLNIDIESCGLDEKTIKYLGKIDRAIKLKDHCL